MLDIMLETDVAWRIKEGQGQLQEEVGGAPSTQQRKRGVERPEHNLWPQQQQREGPRVRRAGWADELNLLFNRFDSTPSPSPTHQSTDPGPSHPFWHTSSPSLRTSGTSAAPSTRLFTPLHFTPPSPHLPQLESSPTPRCSLSITADPGEEGAHEDQGKKGYWSGWHQLQTAEGLCSPALSGGSAHLKPQPQSGEGSCPVEDFLRGSCKTAHPREPNHFSPDLPPDEDHGEDYTELPQTPG